MANLTVAVQDGNNINVEVTPTPNQVIVVDRGVAGVGIESVAIVYNAPTYYLEFTYTNGTTELVALPAIAAGVTSFNTRIGVVTLTSSDVTTALGYTPPTPTGTGASGTWAISVSGNAANVTGVVAIANGGTNATTAPNARTSLGLGSAAVLNAGTALGVATLDAGGTVPLSQIPASIQGGLNYQGTWNASTNTPTLTSSVGTKGYYYAVSVAGSTNLNGITDWNIGDLAVYDGTAWQQIDNTDAVTSVNGFTGTVVLGAADVGAVGTITSSDGSIDVVTTGATVDLVVSAASPASTLLASVRNQTGATLTKGTVVYISGATGNKALVSKAIATSDATSAQTFGVITTNLANNANGYVTVIGAVTNLNTSAFTEGVQLYLSSTTAGEYTATKQYAPNHLVYVGIVTRSHPTQGTIEVKIQNGYEMDELHDVFAQTPSNGNVLIWNATTQLWTAAGITAGTGVSVTNGAGSITITNTLPSLGGDVVGAASATDNAVARYDGTTGKIIQNSAVTIADDGATVIAANSSSDGLRITQTGAGNALLVEDAANPDATPFVVANDGRVVVGYTSALPAILATTPLFQVQTNIGSSDFASIGIFNWIAGAQGTTLQLSKSRSGTIGTNGVVSSGDVIGRVQFNADDGTQFITAARIDAFVDGTPGTNDMPGRLVFLTTADGASSPTERMRITSTGNVGIGTATLTAQSFRLGNPITGGTTAWGAYWGGTVQPTVTSSAIYNQTIATTAANGAVPYTITGLRHHSATQGTFNADSTVTNQYGFITESTVTGATNNYGFYSNIASGIGRWNFYANGTAANYFGGNTIVEVTDNTNAALRITQLGTGNALLVEDSANPDASPFVVDSGGNLILGSTTLASTPSTFVSTIQSHSTANQSLGIGLFNYATGTASRGDVAFYKSVSGTSGTLSAVSTNTDIGSLNFFGAGDASTWVRAGIILAEVDTGTVSATSMPGRLVFATTPDGSATSVERMRISATGDVGIGTTASSYRLDVAPAAAGAALRIRGGSGGSSAIQFTDAVLSAQWAVLNATAASLSLAHNAILAFTTNTVERLRIASTGIISLGATAGSESLRVTPVASAVNYLEAKGQVTTGGPSLNAVGSDTNIDLIFITKGTGSSQFYTNSNVLQFLVGHTASAVNYLRVTGGATGTAATMSAAGTDTNIDIALTPKGTGVLKFGTYTAGILAQAGYITVKDAAGNTRNLLVG
jgi:hypothetical protein